MKVDFYKHNIGDLEKAELNKVLDSVFLTAGPTTKAFEEKFSQYLGSQHVVGVTSCTAALFLSLKALGIGEGDEVITTPLTFIATSNAILQVGAKPVFVDVEKKTGNIDANLIEAAITPKTKAIMPVHLYGQMCDMKAIDEMAKRKNLFIVEDCAHCVEGERDGIKVGSLSDAACYSFYATKNLTCGEGGAISTNQKALAEKIFLLRSHGMNKSAADRYTNKYQHWDMSVLGWKFNMDDIKAALLLTQLPRIEKLWNMREHICQTYEKNFSRIKNLELLEILPHSKSARHLFTILVDPNKRDEIMWALQNKGIGVAVNYRPVHLLAYYKQTFGYSPGRFPNAEYIGNRTITLPLYPRLTQEEVDYIIATTEEVVSAGV